MYGYMHRYGGDTYAGGNPWVLATVGFGEFLHRLAAEYEQIGHIQLDGGNVGFFQSIGLKSVQKTHFQKGDRVFEALVERIRVRGDAFIARAGFHALKDGSFSEQIDQHTGFMRGAPNLTWSHASFLTAFWSRGER